MSREKVHARFKDAPWYKGYDVVVGGLGGIGSWTSFLLGRSGHNLYLYDFDTIDASNMGGQLYSRQNIGQKKNSSMRTIITNMCEEVSVDIFDRFTSDSVASRIMFSCFDNMAARKVFFDRWLETCKECEKTREEWKIAYPSDLEEEYLPSYLKGPMMFIDGRLEAETAIIYCIKNEEEAKKWQQEWFPDEKVADAPCTFRATSHNAAIIAGLMVGHMNNVIANYIQRENIRVTPWKTNYELPTMTFNSEELVTQSV
jgi:hypothetical protein